MKVSLLVLSVAAKVYFKETFDSLDKWVVSQSKDDYGKWEISNGKFHADEERSKALKTTEDAKFYAISAKFDQVFDHKDKDFIVQFSAKFEQNIDCGGGYVKIMPPGFKPEEFNGDTVYNVMFGPDICGNNKKVHAILNYKNENHLIKKQVLPGSDQLTHLYTFIIHPDQTYEILVDQESKASGKLIEDWDLLPPAKIKDPKQSKPKDWVDSPKMDDPNDVKPEGYGDVPANIPDPDATKPEDWDDEDDGVWEAPMIPNPEYKGEWKPKQIDNPDYKGPWVHPEIDNPEFVNDESIYAYKSEYIGFDLWQVKSGTLFDNIIVTDSIEEANEFAASTFVVDAPLEKAAKDKLDDEEAEKLKQDLDKEEEKEDEHDEL
ncbi:hypothetical protein HDV04_000415 [Boothiomyces sp. JEL0838]|nr:hypothetical protein HDV04_000395 [Boothiomyces sp. JEL0838]KAJ3314453.1 hypothetical protein HDV04_000415 [Boothiomyces sp. JEL0838]